MLSTTKDSLKMILFFVTTLLVIILISYGEAESDKANWNNGECKICGCKWEYQDMFYTKNGRCVYIYCDKNGHTINIRQNYGMP